MRSQKRASLWALAVAILLLTPGQNMALESVVIGDELDWLGEGTASVGRIDAVHRSPLVANRLLVGNAPGQLIEFDSPDWPGSILPLRFEEGENIATGTLERGGGITAPNILDFGRSISVGSSDVFDENDLRISLEEIMLAEPGGELDAFQRKNFNAFGILVFVDLGGRFGVDRIRFYPRNTIQSSPGTPFENDFMRAFELFTNDGTLTASGNKIWDPLLLVNDNQDPIVDVTMDPPRLVQSIRLRSTSNINFEIDEFEIYGKGFLSETEYISDIFDMSEPAVWGDLRWAEEIIGDTLFSKARISTRTGSDDNPFVFTRVLAGKRDAEPIPFSLLDPLQEMGLDEYEKLPAVDGIGRQWEAGPITDDLFNWSPFSTPYPATEANGPGIAITSPSPRQFLQFRVLFSNAGLESARAITSLSFDFQTPAYADEVVAEVFPREVEASTLNTFTFAMRSAIRSAGKLGYDIVEISTPSKVASIDRIELTNASGSVLAERTFSGLEDADMVDGFQILTVDADRFRLAVPLVEEDGVLLTVQFQTGVLTYSTNFRATVEHSTVPGASQPAVSGNAATLSVDDIDDFSGTTVLSPPLIGGHLLDLVAVVPNPFTPNGDGINDEAAVQYSLLSVSADRRVNIDIYDLSGRRVRSLHDGLESNGRFEDKLWDGRSDGGKLVPPGIYIARLAVDGDAIQEEKSIAVSVVY